jgi:hypothetical protein
MNELQETHNLTEQRLFQLQKTLTEAEEGTKPSVKKTKKKNPSLLISSPFPKILAIFLSKKIIISIVVSDSPYRHVAFHTNLVF